jgi:hypothetical protein
MLGKAHSSPSKANRPAPHNATQNRNPIQSNPKVDDELAELFLSEQPIAPAALKAAIRRATISNKFQVGGRS